MSDNLKITFSTEQAVKAVEKAASALDMLKASATSLKSSSKLVDEFRASLSAMEKISGKQVASFLADIKKQQAALSQLQGQQTRLNNSITRLGATPALQASLKGVNAQIDALMGNMVESLDKLQGAQARAHSRALGMAKARSAALAAEVAATKAAAAEVANFGAGVPNKDWTKRDLLERYRLETALSAKAHAEQRAWTKSVASDTQSTYNAIYRYKVAEAKKASTQEAQFARSIASDTQSTYNAIYRYKVAEAKKAAALEAAANTKALQDDLAGFKAMQALRTQYLLQEEAKRARITANSAKAQMDAALAKSTSVYQSYNPKTQLAGRVVQPLVAAPGRTPSAALPKPTEVNAVSGAFSKLSRNIFDSHSAVRGLASGFGLLYLTWGATLPLLTGAAISFGIANTLKAGKELSIILADIQFLSGVSATEMQTLNAVLVDTANAAAGPKQVAEGLRYLTLAGLSATEAVKGIGVVLNLANLSNMDVGKASESLVAISTAFGYTANGFERVADVIVSVSAASMADISDMTDAFRTSSVVAEQFGASIDDVAISLGLLSQIGIKGSAAGTALRQSYVELAGSSKEAVKTMKEVFNLSIFDDALGKVKPRMEIVSALAEKLSKMPISEQFAKLQQISNERGMKSLSTDLQALIKQWQETGRAMNGAAGEAEYVKSKLTELQEAVANSAGTTALAAAAKNMSFGRQWEAAGADMQRQMRKAFEASEGYAVRFMAAVRKVFQSDEVQGALTGLITTVLRLGTTLLDHIGTIASVGKALATAAAGYLAYRAGLVVTAAATNLATAATARLTMGLAAVGPMAMATAAKVRLAGLAAGWVGAALTVAAGLWALYGDKAENALSRASRAAKEHYDLTIEGLDDQLARMRAEEEQRAKGLNGQVLGAAVQRQLLIESVRLKNEEEQATLRQVVAERKLVAEKARADVTDPEDINDRYTLRFNAADYAVREAVTDLRNAERAGNQRILAVADRTNEVIARAMAEAKRAQAEMEARRPKGGQPGTPDEGSPGAAYRDLKQYQSAVAKANSEQLQALRDGYAQRLEILKDYHDAGMISEGEYLARTIAENQFSYQVVSEKLASNLKSQQDELDAHKVHVLATTKLTGKDLATATAKLDEDLKQDRLNLQEAYNTDKAKLDQNAADVERKLVIDQAKALKAIREKTAASIAASNDRIFSAEEEVRVEASTRSLSGPAQAAAQARLKVESAVARELRALDQELSDERKKQTELEASLVYTTNAAAWDKVVEAVGASDKRQEELRKASLDRRTQAEIEAGKMASIAYGTAVQKEFEGTRDKITDALVTALVDGGQEGGQKLRAMLEQQLRQPITMLINALVEPILGSVTGGSKAASSKGLAGGLADAFDKLTGGFDKLGADVSGTMLKAGDWLATSTNDTLAKVGEGLQGFSQVAGGMAKGLAGFATGMQLRNSLSGGYSLGKGVDNWQKVQVAGASILGPAFGAIAGAVTGAINRLFGRKLQDSGLQGSFGGSGFSGESYKFYKGGLFRSDKTTTEALDSELSASLSNQFGALKSSVSGMASALGMATADIEAYTYQMKVSFQGLSEDEIGQKLAEEFSKMGEGMAQLAPGIDIYRKAGESAADALSRLYGYYVNEKQAEIAILNAQGKRIEALNMQRNLEVALLDDVEKASKKRVYALEDEVYAATEAASLQKEVDDLILTSTELRAKERENIVQSNRALFDYVTALENVADAEDALIDALNTLVSEFDKVIDGFGAIVDSLIAYQKTLTAGPAALLSPQAQYLATKAALDANQVKALAGDKDALSAVESLAQEFLDASQAYNASSPAYFSDLEKVKGMVTSATSAAQTQVDIAEKAKTDAEKQLEALGEVKTSVDSVEEATRAVQAAVIQLTKASALETYSSMVSSGATPLSAYTQAAATIAASALPQADKESSLTQLKATAISDTSDYVMKAYSSAIASGKTNVQAATEAHQYLQSSASMMTAAQMATAFEPVKSQALGAISVSEDLKAQIRAAEATENSEFARLGFAYGGGFTVDAAGKPVWDFGESNGQANWATNGWQQQDALAAMRGGTGEAWGAYLRENGPAPTQDPNAPWNLLDTLSRQYSAQISAQTTSLGALKFADGGAFTNGVVSRPINFSMGQMGEAGPEAIMPLTRMADGSLGVAYSGQQNNAALLAEIKALRAEVAELKQHTAAGVRVAQAVGKAQIETLETIADATTDTAHNQRLAELAR